MSIIMRTVVLALILFSIFTVYLSMPRENEFAHRADEGHYFMYAKIIKEKGISQFPLLWEYHLSDKIAQQFPNPASRFGHILITSFWFKIFPNTFVSLAHFSFLCYILLIIVCFYFIKKFFDQDIAYISTLLLSSSPIIMYSGRRCLQDSTVNLSWALSVWLFFDFLVNKRKTKFVTFVIVYSLTITIKESAIALLPFFVLSYLLYRYKYKQDISYSYLLWLFVAPLIIVGGAYLFLFNGLDNLVSLIRFIAGVHFPVTMTNTYSLFGMGPWYKYVIDYLILNPIATLLFIGYFFYILFTKRFDWKVTYFLVSFVIIFVLFSSMKYTKIVRFIAVLDFVIGLFAALALYELFRQKNKDYQSYFVILAAVFIFCVNYVNVLDLFFNFNIYDPISYVLLAVKNIVPYCR
ncbi:MAG: glycosyltransferase family 39 protein [Candidatus Omnitrophota bacterium]